MNKLLVEIYLPAIAHTYDVFIPYDAKIYELNPLIAGAAEKLSDGLFVSNDAVLCDGESGAILNINLTVEDLKLQNGSKLMLV